MKLNLTHITCVTIHPSITMALTMMAVRLVRLPCQRCRSRSLEATNAVQLWHDMKWKTGRELNFKFYGMTEAIFSYYGKWKC